MTEAQRRRGEGHHGDGDDLLWSGVGTEGSRLDSLTPGAERGVMRLWRQAVAKSQEASQARRVRVLQQPDLTRRLTEPPLRLSDPARWSGWIPPKTLAEDTCVNCGSGDPRPICRGWPHRARVNDSPVRRQLVEIAAEAMRRESGR